MSLDAWLWLVVYRNLALFPPPVCHSVSGGISTLLYLPPLPLTLPLTWLTFFFKCWSSEMGIRVISGRHSLNPPGWCGSPHLGTPGGAGWYGQAQTTRQHNSGSKCDRRPSGTEISHKSSLSDALSQQFFGKELRSDRADRRRRAGRSGLGGGICWVL